MRVKLVVLTGQSVGSEVEVAGTVTIGRTTQCDLSLPVATVSREHAKVFAKDGVYYVVDLNSSNGTRVNGKGVTRHVLADGDEIQCGDQTLRFVVERGAQGPTPSAAVAEELAADAAAPAPAVGGAPSPWEMEVAVRAAEPARTAPAKEPAAGGVEIQSRNAVLQFHRIPDRKGLLREDLAQRGLLGRWLVILVVLALAASVFWLAMRLATPRPTAEPGLDDTFQEGR